MCSFQPTDTEKCYRVTESTDSLAGKSLRKSQFFQLHSRCCFVCDAHTRSHAHINRQGQCSSFIQTCVSNSCLCLCLCDNDCCHKPLFMIRFHLFTAALKRRKKKHLCLWSRYGSNVRLVSVLLCSYFGLNQQQLQSKFSFCSGQH